METEIWKALPGIPGVEVSTFGRVRTLDRVISSENGTRSLKGRVLKQHNHHGGYLNVGVSIDGKRVTKLVHRLVAQTFLPNPDNLPQINHLDCDRRNNNINNLEWCTPKYNSQYRVKFGKSRGVPVFAINLTTLKVSKYRSQHEASRALGVYQANINSVIRGRYKQTGNYLFVNDYGNAVDVINQKLHDIGKTGLKI